MPSEPLAAKAKCARIRGAGDEEPGAIATVFINMIGTSIVAFIETGVIAAGLTGFFTQFFYGLIIILSLIFQRFNGGRVR